MKEIYLDLCFWGLSDTHERCNCDKIYFDLYLDFEDVRLIVCKDYYVNFIKNIKQSIFQNDFFIYVVKYKEDYNILNNFKNMFLEYIINKYIKTPIYNSLESNNNEYFNMFKCYNNISQIVITISERPYYSYTINLYKFLEFYYDNYDEYQHKANKVKDRCYDYLKMHLSSLPQKKYKELCSKIDKLCIYNFDRKTHTIDTTKNVEYLNDIIKELIKLKN